MWLSQRCASPRSTTLAAHHETRNPQRGEEESEQKHLIQKMRSQRQDTLSARCLEGRYNRVSEMTAARDQGADRRHAVPGQQQLVGRGAIRQDEEAVSVVTSVVRRLFMTATTGGISAVMPLQPRGMLVRAVVWRGRTPAGEGVIGVRVMQAAPEQHVPENR